MGRSVKVVRKEEGSLGINGAAVKRKSLKEGADPRGVADDARAVKESSDLLTCGEGVLAPASTNIRDKVHMIGRSFGGSLQDAIRVGRDECPSNPRRGAETRRGSSSGT